MVTTHGGVRTAPSHNCDTYGRYVAEHVLTMTAVQGAGAVRPARPDAGR